MTVKQEQRIAMKCLKKAVKYLRVIKRYEVLSPEWNAGMRMFSYFKGIYTAHESALFRD